MARFVHIVGSDGRFKLNFKPPPQYITDHSIMYHEMPLTYSTIEKAARVARAHRRIPWRYNSKDVGHVDYY